MKGWWPRAHEKYWWQCGGDARLEWWGSMSQVCVCVFAFACLSVCLFWRRCELRGCSEPVTERTKKKRIEGPHNNGGEQRRNPGRKSPRLPPHLHLCHAPQGPQSVGGRVRLTRCKSLCGTVDQPRWSVVYGQTWSQWSANLRRRTTAGDKLKPDQAVSQYSMACIEECDSWGQMALIT